MTEWTAHERAKYQAMWGRKEYRERSPGQRFVSSCMGVFRSWHTDGIAPSVIDYGCGTGRATIDFARAGYLSVGVDITANALEERVPFVEACLWALPDSLGPSMFAFCADVMEHLPEPHICNVLQSIRMRTSTLGCFLISWGEDDCGKLIGQELHITKRPSEWWREQFRRTGWELISHGPGDRPQKEFFFVTPRREG